MTPGEVTTIRGNRLGGRIHRRPRRDDTKRRCWCGTRLSAYNQGDACYAHTGPKFPRVRGRVK